VTTRTPCLSRTLASAVLPGLLACAALSLTGSERASAVPSGQPAEAAFTSPRNSAPGTPPRAGTGRSRFRPGLAGTLLPGGLSGLGAYGLPWKARSEGVERALDAVMGGAGEAGPDRAALLRAGHGAHAAVQRKGATGTTPPDPPGAAAPSWPSDLRSPAAAGGQAAACGLPGAILGK